VARTRLTRIESQAATRERLLDAAAALFERQGFHRTSVGEIAEEAGFTTGAVYSNFARKEDLAMAVLERSFTTSLQDLVVALAGHPDLTERLVAVIDWRRELLAKSAPLGHLRLELSLHAQRDEPLREAIAAGQQLLRDVLAGILEAQAADLGATLTVDPTTLACAVLDIADGTAIGGGLEPGGPHSEAFALVLATLLVQSVVPPPVAPEDETAFVERLMDAARRSPRPITGRAGGSRA
jgi:AcrR family transcriptional regulator